MGYEWTAIYSDFSELKQFNNGKEMLFKDIDQAKIIAFRIDSSIGSVVVDLINGLIMCNGLVLEFPELYNLKEKYRLIYFRRNKVDIGVGNKLDNHTVTHNIGYQVTVNGVNKQIILSVTDNNYCKILRK